MIKFAPNIDLGSYKQQNVLATQKQVASRSRLKYCKP